MDTPIGAFIDAEGIVFDLGEDDMITDVLVIAMVMGPDGRSWVCGRAGEGTDIVTEEGMLSRSMKLLDERWALRSVEGGDD